MKKPINQNNLFQGRQYLKEKKYWLFTILVAIILCFGVLEITARIIVYWQWTSDKKEMMTTHSSVKGRYQNHAFLPYMLSANYKKNYAKHNSFGFRGKEFLIEKKTGVKRIAAIGGSTTYGPKKPYPEVLEELLNRAGIPAEVLNVGVPGWTSAENLVNLLLRVLPLKPDLVVVYQGRNDLLPQSYNNFQEDYSHYKKADYNFSNTNYLCKPLFKISHLFMILSLYKGDRFGYSSVEEHPIYGTINYENRPTAKELTKNLNDLRPTRAYRNNVKSMVLLCQGNGIPIILSTMAFVEEEIRTSGILTDEPKIFEPIGKQLERNNKVMREVGKLYNVPVAETSVLTKNPEWFVDDCHMKPEGHEKRAYIIFKTIMENDIFK